MALEKKKAASSRKPNLSIGGRQADCSRRSSWSNECVQVRLTRARTLFSCCRQLTVAEGSMGSESFVRTISSGRVHTGKNLTLALLLLYG